MPKPAGATIRAKREQLGMKTGDLAAKARLGRSTATNIQNGHNPHVSIEVLWRVAHALGVTDVNELIDTNDTVNAP